MRDFHTLVDEWSPALLRWAYGKTGDPYQAEDLAQEAWLQFFSAAAREEKEGRLLRQPEHLLWKVARYVWLRSLRRRETAPLGEDYADPSDFAEDLADREAQSAQAAWVRQRIVNLNRLQREIFILYYVERVPQKEDRPPPWGGGEHPPLASVRHTEKDQGRSVCHD